MDWRDILLAADLANEDWPARLDQELGVEQADDRNTQPVDRNTRPAFSIKNLFRRGSQND